LTRAVSRDGGAGCPPGSVDAGSKERAILNRIANEICVASERCVFEARNRRLPQEIDVLSQQQTKITETLQLASR